MTEQPTTGHPTICLNMIVRNEEHIILEALRSVADSIDRWVIVDTGSTDRTEELIETFFTDRGIPGELHRRPWRDFATNRTEALELAAGSADFTWVLDADDYLVGRLERSTLDLEVGSYHVPFGTDFRFWRAQIFRSDLPWRFVGVVHEYPTCDRDVPDERLVGDFHLIARSAGNRSRDPDRFARDAELLEAELDRDPDDVRTVFYLAQSLRDAGRPAEALAWYERRIEMGGWAEEVWYSRYQRATCLERMGRPWSEVQEALLEAWDDRPGRLEPLHDLARHHRLAGRYRSAHLFASAALDVTPSDDSLFVQADVHRWRILDELSIAAYYCGFADQSRELCELLLSSGDLPDDQRERVADNLAFAVRALEWSGAEVDIP